MSKVENLTINGNPRLFEREEIKKTFMVAGYGAREKRLKNQLKEDLKSQFSQDIYDAFIESIDHIAPGVLELMEEINDLWDGSWNSVSYIMPNNFKVLIKPINSEWVEFELMDNIKVKAKVNGVEKVNFALLLFVGIIHSTDALVAAEVINRANYDKFALMRAHEIIKDEMANRTEDVPERRFARMMCINVVENIGDNVETLTWTELENAEALCRTMLSKKTFQVITIHDAYRSLANYSKSMKNLYNEVLADINDSDLMADILTQIVGYELEVETGDLDSMEILEAKYSLC